MNMRSSRTVNPPPQIIIRASEAAGVDAHVVEAHLVQTTQVPPNSKDLSNLMRTEGGAKAVAEEVTSHRDSKSHPK